MNLWDAVIGIVVIAAVALAAVRLARNKRRGKCTCGCEGCGGRCGKKQ